MTDLKKIHDVEIIDVNTAPKALAMLLLTFFHSTSPKHYKKLKIK
jgi:hypothetical protein